MPIMKFGNTSNSDSNTTNEVINLSKGGRINLTKEVPGLKKIMVGLGWDCQRYKGHDDFDLDASAYLVNKFGRVNNNGFIFYGNLSGPDKCVVHQGDELTGGKGDGETTDDEQIFIDLDLIPDDIEKVAIAVTIYMADERRQNFGQVSNAYIRLVNTDTGKEEARYDLGDEFSLETAVIIGEIYKHNGEWKFNALGQGFSGGLVEICKNFGINAAYNG